MAWATQVVFVTDVNVLNSDLKVIDYLPRQGLNETLILGRIFGNIGPRLEKIGIFKTLLLSGQSAFVFLVGIVVLVPCRGFDEKVQVADLDFYGVTCEGRPRNFHRQFTQVP